MSDYMQSPKPKVVVDGVLFPHTRPEANKKEKENESQSQGNKKEKEGERKEKKEKRENRETRQTVQSWLLFTESWVEAEWVETERREEREGELACWCPGGNRAAHPLPQFSGGGRVGSRYKELSAQYLLRWLNQTAMLVELIILSEGNSTVRSTWNEPVSRRIRP
ncbi:hypothetical protein MRB53_015140 [Persea americana]|uniref:Uncharacterized protein n=1 Tax=Persea americana TaxID=3435 RepID=A0ACC2KCU0_PERAE|nr:hypothetical protein MRB53_015140 [Persea americana]